MKEIYLFETRLFFLFGKFPIISQKTRSTEKTEVESIFLAPIIIIHDFKITFILGRILYLLIYIIYKLIFIKVINLILNNGKIIIFILF